MGLLAYLKTQFVVHLLIGFVFVVSGLVINFAQLCTLVLWPVNKQLYRRLNCRLAYSLWSREYRPCTRRGGGCLQDGRCSGGPGGHSPQGTCRKVPNPRLAIRVDLVMFRHLSTGTHGGGRFMWFGAGLWDLETTVNSACC